MKIQSLWKIGSLVIIGTALFAFNAAATFDENLTIKTPGVVGILAGQYAPGKEALSVAERILGSTAITLVASDQGASASIAPYDYVLAKYDGPNGGGVLFDVSEYVKIYGNILPQTSATIWVNGEDKGYGLSGFEGFNSTAVPEPSTVIAGALILLPFGASTLRALRNKRA